jgi:hypothetical protein
MHASGYISNFAKNQKYKITDTDIYEGLKNLGR